MKPEEKDYFLETSCAGEIIRLSEWWDQRNDKDERDGYFWTCCFSIYNNMFSGEAPLTHQLRHIWRIITTGHPWKDEIVLDIKTAKILRDKLVEMISRAEDLEPKVKG